MAGMGTGLMIRGMMIADGSRTGIVYAYPVGRRAFLSYREALFIKMTVAIMTFSLNR